MRDQLKEPTITVTLTETQALALVEAAEAGESQTYGETWCNEAIAAIRAARDAETAAA